MGHALRQIRRCLVDGGTLVDLRPISASCPLELVTRAEPVRVAEIDAFGMELDDAASDAAVQEAVDDGWLDRLHRSELGLYYYWDGLDEVAAYFEGSRRMTGITPSFEELRTRLRELRREVPARLRCRRAMMLAVYETPE